MADAALVIILDGTTYNIRLSDLTAIDAKDFRAAVGVSMAQAMTGENTDLDVVAGLVWLARRKRERGLPYLKVAKDLTYASDLEMKESTDEPEADDSGEA